MLSTSSILDTVPRGLTFLRYLGTAALQPRAVWSPVKPAWTHLAAALSAPSPRSAVGTVRPAPRPAPRFLVHADVLSRALNSDGSDHFFATESLESAGLCAVTPSSWRHARPRRLCHRRRARRPSRSGRGSQSRRCAEYSTATCGGLIRDVLCAQEPGHPLSGEGEFGALYAPTALAGAAFYSSLATYSAVAPPVAILLGVGATIAMRIAAFSYRVHLPAMHKYVTAGRESAPQPSLVFSQTHLFVTAYGADQLGLVAALSQVISRARANISASKIITIGRDIAFMMVVSVPTDAGPLLPQGP